MTLPTDADRYSRQGDLWLPFTAEQIGGAIDSANLSGLPAQIWPMGSEMLRGAVGGQAGNLDSNNGWTGVSVLGGRLQDYDHNPRITPEVWRGCNGRLGRVDEMRLSDPVVAAIWLSYVISVSKTPFDIEAAPDGDRHALADALFIRRCYFDELVGGWRRYVEQAAELPLRGTSLHQQIWKRDDDLGEAIGWGPGPVVKLVGLEPRGINTVERWLVFDDEHNGGRRWGVEQSYESNDGPTTGGNTAWASPVYSDGDCLHPDQLLHMVWQPRGDSPEGTSILRSCHASWAVRKTYRKLEAAGFERGALGIPYLEVAPGVQRGSEGKLELMLQEMRTGLRSNAGIIPRGYTLKFAEFPFEAEAIREAISFHGREMGRAAGTPYLFTGEGNGTEALVKTQILISANVIQGVVDHIAQEHTHGPYAPIRQLITANRGDQVRAFPKMKPGQVRIGDVADLVGAIRDAVVNGLVTKGADIEAHVRNLLSLPDMSPETEEAWLHQQMQPAIPTNITDDDDDDDEVSPDGSEHTDDNPAAPPADDEE